MPSITIKDVPDGLLERLRQRAARDHRSMNREVLHLLDLALSGEIPVAGATALARHVDTQVEAWRQLAGRWQSDVDAEEEIQRIYAARTAGRAVDL